MINIASGAGTLINSEQIARSNQAQPETKPSAPAEESQESGAERSRESSYSDVTSFSPQALALARQAAPTPAGQATDQQQAEPQGRGQGGESLSARLLNITA